MGGGGGGGGVIYFLEYLYQGRGSGGVRKCKKKVESLLNYPRISMNNEKIIKYCFFQIVVWEWEGI